MPSGPWSGSGWPARSGREPVVRRRRRRREGDLRPTGGTRTVQTGMGSVTYVILAGDFFISQVGDGDLTVAQLADLVLRPLAGLAGVEKVPEALVVDLNKAGCERELTEVSPLESSHRRGKPSDVKYQNRKGKRSD